MGFLSWQEREAYQEQYGALFAGLLEEMLTLIEGVAFRALLESEAKVRVKSRFAELMQAHVPSCRAAVAAYQARIAKEEAIKNKAAAEYEEKRQQRLKDEEAAREKDAAEREAARVKKSLADEAALREEVSKIRAQENRELQERML